MPKSQEGTLYKTLDLHGHTFNIVYGYYESYESSSDFGDPIPIYPDFTKTPVYTDEGTPFVTMMQDACASYRGESKKTSDTTCAECKYFKRGEEWFGICLCPKNKTADK